MAKILWGFLSLALGIVAAMLSSSKVAGFLGWPIWLVGLMIFLDGVLVAITPFTFTEYSANIALWGHRIALARESADYPPGCAYMLILTTNIVPSVVLLYMLYLSTR